MLDWLMLTVSPVLEVLPDVLPVAPVAPVEPVGLRVLPVRSVGLKPCPLILSVMDFLQGRFLRHRLSLSTGGAATLVFSRRSRADPDLAGGLDDPFDDAARSSPDPDALIERLDSIGRYLSEAADYLGGLAPALREIEDSELQFDCSRGGSV